MNLLGAMPRLPADLSDVLAFEEQLVDDGLLMGKRRPHVVDRAAPRNELAGFELMLADVAPDGGWRDFQQDGDLGAGHVAC